MYLNIDGIKAEESTYLETARVLSVINPGINDAEGFLNMMRDMTSQHGRESAYFGTAGFYIVCFDVDEPIFDEENRDLIENRKVRYAKAVLMPYSVERYLKEIGKL